VVIINRNDLSIRTLNRVLARQMSNRTVTGFGAKVSSAGVPFPRPYYWPELAHKACSPGILADTILVHSKRTRTAQD